MILNTFIKTNKIQVNSKQKILLGISIARCFRSKYQNSIKKVNISENGIKMEVIDYPKEFLESKNVHKIITRFLKKYVSKKII